MLILKNYQQGALDALGDYFRLVREHGAKLAFMYQTDRPYHSVAALPDLPYICLRIPTGGGKTLLAGYSISVTLREFLHQERGLVLWLTPTNAIKEQTLAALRNLKHPYRQALDTTLGQVTVMDLTEALSVQRATLDGSTVIIVSTLAASRVQDTDVRKVYDENGMLMSHFEGLTEAQIAPLDKYENGKPKPSLANVLCLRHPIVIMDEAHNARTSLSFDTLARFRPACILEYTATPTQPPDPDPSNVLYHVSAYELKAEHMIKLPLRFETHGDWKEAIAAAIAKRKELEDLALVERPLTGDYLRPIVLLQAQPRSKRGDTLTVEVVKGQLQDQGVPPDWIAIETGEVREVKQWEDEHKRSLFDDTCPIRFIITVAALREGWDCPFAYVLCSVAEQASSTAVEQILGRVLRLPKATQKQHEALNQSYAFVTSHRFSQAAQAVEGLIHGLEANGFTHFEAQTEIQAQQPLFPPETAPLFAAADEARRTPAERGEVFAVPQLALWVEGTLEPLVSDFFLDAQWTIANCDAALTETEFPTHASQAPAVEVDITAQGKFKTRFLEDLDQDLILLNLSSATTIEELVGWFDRHIPHGDLDQADMQLFLLNMVDKLIHDRGLTLDQLSRERFRLLGAAANKVKQHRNEAKYAGYQQMLFSDLAAPIEVSANRVFAYTSVYPANAVYEELHDWKKHYYRAVGAMNDEEARCAKLIDSLPKVKYWVRNLERRDDFSFWLPTPTDKFYPDFVALLNDDRILVIEYKGEGYMNTRDTDQKRAIGNLWAQRSNGQCIFLLVGADDYEPRLRAVAG